jgi:hypothetical protein
MAELVKKAVLADMRNDAYSGKDQFQVRRVYNSIRLVAGSYLSEDDVKGLIASEWAIQIEMPK